MPEAYAQKVAVKSNLLYDATATFNLGVEFGLARKWTLDVPVNLNPWKFNDGTRLRHWGVQPEVRYWFCERFRRTFIGLHAHYADFNVGNFPDWSFISENFCRSCMDFEKALGDRSYYWFGVCSYRLR